MTLYEAMLKVKHDCPFGSISEHFPSVKMFVWYNPDHEIVEIATKDPKDYSDVIEEFSKQVDIIERHTDGTRLHLVTTRCCMTIENSVKKNIESFNMLQVQPEVYEKGWEYYHVIAFRHEDFQNFLQSLEKKGFKVEILHKSPFTGFIANSLTMTAEAIFSDLTQKQLDALLTSHNKGYYRLPRKSNLTAIAHGRHIPRTSFEEHLRKAENKLITNLMPYLKLFEQIPLEKRKRFGKAHVEELLVRP